VFGRDAPVAADRWREDVGAWFTAQDDHAAIDLAALDPAILPNTAPDIRPVPLG
jgi:hypothetical protein